MLNAVWSKCSVFDCINLTLEIAFTRLKWTRDAIGIIFFRREERVEDNFVWIISACTKVLIEEVDLSVRQADVLLAVLKVTVVLGLSMIYDQCFWLRCDVVSDFDSLQEAAECC